MSKIGLGQWNPCGLRAGCFFQSPLNGSGHSIDVASRLFIRHSIIAMATQCCLIAGELLEASIPADPAARCHWNSSGVWGHVPFQRSPLVNRCWQLLFPPGCGRHPNRSPRLRAGNHSSGADFRSRRVRFKTSRVRWTPRSARISSSTVPFPQRFYGVCGEDDWAGEALKIWTETCLPLSDRFWGPPILLIY